MLNSTRDPGFWLVPTRLHPSKETQVHMFEVTFQEAAGCRAADGGQSVRWEPASLHFCWFCWVIGPEWCCCSEASESDCNGPPCAPACLPLRFTTHLIRSAENSQKEVNHTLCSHTFSASFVFPFLFVLLTLLPLILSLLSCVLAAFIRLLLLPYSLLH